MDDTIIANWGETVLDGTPCTLGTNNMCIDGICKVSLIDLIAAIAVIAVKLMMLDEIN